MLSWVEGGVDKSLYGKLEEALDLDGYRIFTLTDSKGNIHFFDSMQGSVEVRKPSRPISAFEAGLADDHFGPSERKVDEPELRKKICGRFLSLRSSPGYARIRKLVDQKLVKKDTKAVKAIYEKYCRVSAGASLGAIPLWGASSVLRALDVGADSYIHQHSSNFYFGLAGIGFMTSCLAHGSPRFKAGFLSAALGGYAALSIAEEVSVDGKPLVSTAGNVARETTDWHDLGASALAEVSSIAMYALLEKSSRMKFAQVCSE